MILRKEPRHFVSPQCTIRDGVGDGNISLYTVYIAFQNKKIFSKQIIKHSFIIADVTFLFY